jgi:hypothetical protein
VRDEFVGEHGGVAYDLDLVDGDGGDFSKDGASEGVGEGEGGALEDEVDAVEGSLETGSDGLALSVREGGKGGRYSYFSDCDFGASGLDVHGIVRVCAAAIAIVGHGGRRVGGNAGFGLSVRPSHG